MCGITGIFSSKNIVHKDEIIAMTRALKHRGPDNEEIYINQNIALGHTRLAILDTSDAGSCPMKISQYNKNVVITFNGEIYNFIELRDELQKSGYIFHSDTDTEVVAVAYLEWGHDCLKKFNGMWAFTIWDAEKNEIFISRDRFGIKPLYYLSFNNKFYFASELKAFLNINGYSPQLNFDEMNNVLNRPNATEYYKETLYKNVFRVLPGEIINVDQTGNIESQIWWKTSDHLIEIPEKYSDQIEIFKDIFFDALSIRLRSDVKMATSLSGGLDSSSVACSINHLLQMNHPQRMAQKNQQLFIATFPGTEIDEKNFADQVVNKLGVDAYYWEFDEKESLKNIVDSIWSLESVYWGINVPVWSLYKEMSNQGIRVSLDGHGADELMGGYMKYLKTPYNELNSELYDDYHKYLQPTLLRNFDRASMSHGVEVRSPFWDWRLVCFVSSLPVDSKIGGGFTKRILRDAMTGIIPDNIKNRRLKIGFSSPMLTWFKGEMKPMINSIINDKLWLDNPFWDGKYWQKLAQHRLKNDDWSFSEMKKVWTYMNVIIWYKLFVQKTKISDLGYAN